MMLKIVVSLAAVLSLTAAAAVPAAASGPTDPAPPAAITNPDVPRALIDALPTVLQQDPDVIIDPDVELGPIVYPDGTPVEGQDAATMRDARARCGGTATATAVVWGGESVGSCTVWGDAGYKQGYAWGVQDPSGRVCAQGRGFTVSGTRTWYSVSCGTSNAGSEVAWGNVLSDPSLRAMASSTALNAVAWWI